MAIYFYDVVGNVLQIVRGSFPDPSAPVGISAFTPTRGAAGTTTVTVFGRGFSGTPALNEVRFNNGVLATVSDATSVRLTVVAPAGATTGPISVRVGANTGTSAQSFVVLVAPTVTPPSAALFPRQVQTFTATQPSQWRANNVVGGNATLGTITVTGSTATYTAPTAVPPDGLVVTITAASQDDLRLQATAIVEVIAPTDLLRAPAVSVERALGAVLASPLLSPAVSAERALGAVLASPLVSPAVSAERALGAVLASPLTGALLAAAREPVVTAVQDPATGLPARFPRGTNNQNVRILGAGFTGATAVVFATLAGTADSAITINSFTVDSPTQITANVSISPAAAVGFRVARVTVAGVTSSAQGTGGNLLEVLP